MALEQLLEILADGEFHSGEELGEKLGVSRAAIWKHLKKLDELGLQLNSIKGRGYRMPGGLDLLSLERLHLHLSPAVSAVLSNISLSLCIDSTNVAALKAAQLGAAQGALFVAEQQTAGKGRRGRQWVSPFGSNLYFSLVWGFAGGAASLEGLSLAVGVAIRQGLEDFGVAGVQLKWPNDLLIDGRKLAGILLEMTGDASGQCQVVIGVGVNVSMPVASAEQIDQPWINVAEVMRGVGDRNRLLGLILNRLVAALGLFSEQGFASFRDEWQVGNAHRDKTVELHTDSLKVSGVCRGVNESGALLLETGGEVQAFHGGEVSVREVG